MKDFSLSSLYAIAQEMLGGWLLPATLLAVAIALLFLAALTRRSAFGFRRCRAAVGLGIIGAATAAAIAPYATQASFSNIHGAVDWAALAAVAFAAFVAVSVTAFALLTWLVAPAKA